MARFCQVLFAEDVDDVHTMVQGFGLTLECKELSWFYSLSNSVLYDFEVLINAFIKENTKIRIKHNTLTQILDFKQKEKETIKDAIGRLKALFDFAVSTKGNAGRGSFDLLLFRKFEG